MKEKIKIAILSMVLIISPGVSGCGNSDRTPETVVEALVTGYVNGDESAVKECYNQEEDTEESLQSEIDAAIKYYKAHDVKKLNMIECGILSEEQDYTYVYARYNLVLQDNQEYPCIGTYITAKDGEDYYVLPPSKITDEMSSQAADDYAKFMTSEVYQDYSEEYDAFIQKNAGYETELAQKLG